MQNFISITAKTLTYALYAVSAVYAAALVMFAWAYRQNNM